MYPARLFRRALALTSVGAVAAGTFLVAAAPAAHAAGGITTVSPSNAPSNVSSQQLSFTNDGSGKFLGGEKVTLSNGTYSVSNTGTSTSNYPTQDTLSATFDLTQAAPGYQDVAINNSISGALLYACTHCFLVTSNTPTVAGIARTSGTAPSGGTFTITGTGFAAGSAVTVGNGATWTTTGTSATALQGTLSIGASVPGGLSDLTVKNTDGKQATCTACLDVPRVNSTSPTSLPYGAQSKVVHLTGAGLTKDTKVAFAGSGSLVTVTGTTAVDDAHLDVTVNVADPTSGATSPASYQIVTEDKGGGYWSHGFTLVPRPTFASSGAVHLVNPGQGSDLTQVLNGTGFQPGMTVAVSPSTGLTLGAVAVNDAGTTATFNLKTAADAPLTSRGFTLSNPDGGTSLGSASMTPSSEPVVTSASPDSVSQGTGTVSLTVRGSGIGTQAVSTDGQTASKSTNYATPTISLVDPDTGTTAASGSASPASDGTSSVASLSVPTAGRYDVRYTDHNGSVVTCAGCFAVDSLTVSSVAPATASDDVPTTITVDGSGFESGAQLVLQKAGQADIVATGVTTDSSTSTGTVDLTGAAPGVWTVRLTNPTGGTGKLANGFTVTDQKPAITSLSPTALAAGNKQAVLTVNGTDLARGATLVLSCLPTTTCPKAVGEATFVSRAKETFVLDTTGATQGQVTVSVKNTDGQTSNTAMLTISAAPSASSVSPASRAVGSASPFTMTITGTGFSGTPTVTFSGTGVSAGTASAVQTTLNQTSFTVPVTVAGGAPTTARDVVVTNPDGSTATCTGCFTVLAAPTITGVSPTSQKVGTGPTSVTITGTGFDTGGDTVTFSGSGVTAGSPTAKSSTSITVPVTVAAGAAHGARDITVTGTSASNAGTVTSPGAFTVADVPGAPTGLTATPADSALSLAWTAPADNGGLPITGYTVTTTPHAGGTATSKTVTGTSTTVTGLTNGTAYDVVVKATNSVGSGASTAPVTATPATTPGKVTNVLATAGDARATLSWNAPSNGGSAISSYIIKVLPGDSTETQADRTATASPATVTGLVNGKSYQFTVTAVNAQGEGTSSDATPAVTPQAPVAGAPTGLVADPSAASGEVDLSWTAPSSGGAPTSYVVTVTPASGTNKGTTTYPATRTTPTAKVTGLTNGVSVSFTVHAVSSGGVAGPESAAATATPYGVPGSVAAIAGAPGDRSASAAWSAPANDGGRPISGYTATLTPGGTSKTVTTTSVSFTGLTNGTTYTIAVVANNLRGSGPSSSTTVTPVAAPTPTGTPTASPTATATATPTGTPTPTGTATPTATSTPTATTSSIPTLAIDKTAMNVGDSATLTIHGTPGDSVDFYQKVQPATGYTKFRTFTFDDFGYVTVNSFPRTNTSYAAQTAAGIGNVVTLSVRPAVSLRGSSSRRLATFTGVIVPGHGGVRVRVFSVKNGALDKLVATAVTDSQGHYTATHQFVGTGTVQFITQTLSDSIALAGQSNRLNLVIR